MTSTSPKNVSREQSKQRSSGKEKAHKSYRPGVARVRMLLDATLFMEKGVVATTVDDIAARAGIAKGTFYHCKQAGTSSGLAG